MISALIYFLIVILVVCVLYWAISQFAPAPIQKIVLVVCVVIVIIALVYLLMPLAGGMHHL